ncbi:hypothetical protein V8G54_037172 [Vigna mungo]|uniref:Uncharacterized protein n=1 Tax=Vigna mungo TaxID=3915 RepID=A0AAQ3MJ25_VIGMU
MTWSAIWIPRQKVSAGAAAAFFALAITPPPWTRKAARTKPYPGRPPKASIFSPATSRDAGATINSGTRPFLHSSRERDRSLLRGLSPGRAHPPYQPGSHRWLLTTTPPPFTFACEQGSPSPLLFYFYLLILTGVVVAKEKEAATTESTRKSFPPLRIRGRRHQRGCDFDSRNLRIGGIPNLNTLKQRGEEGRWGIGIAQTERNTVKSDDDGATQENETSTKVLNMVLMGWSHLTQCVKMDWRDNDGEPVVARKEVGSMARRDRCGDCS